MRSIVPVALGATLLLSLASCQKDPSITTDGKVVNYDNLRFKVPSGWPAPRYDLSGTWTPEGFALGKKLFFDAQLSRDNTISCNSCHQQEAAFANAAHAVSHGVDGKLGVRNAPSMFNLAWYPNFFWDGGSNHIETQPIAPIQNPVEMDERLPTVIDKLKADPAYPDLFKAAFGTAEITSERMLKSLAIFMATLVSADSKWDRVQAGSAGFTAAEAAGQQLFQQKCQSCHQPPLFTDFSYRNNGLKPTAVNDSGRAHITLLAADLYRFKVPTLRNLRYTAPYMHDGRFNTLAQTLDHYQSGIMASATLDPTLQNGIQLTDTERTNLLAFLNTLNDETFVANASFRKAP